MPSPTYQYPKLDEASLDGNAVNFAGDTIKVSLHTSTYTPADTHKFFSDVTNEVTGTGYTAGGETLTTKTLTFTDDASETAWAASTAYSVGDLVRPTTANGHIYICVVAGTSGGSEPTWPTVANQTVADNTVTWAETGRAKIVIDADNVQWASSTITARYAVIYKDTGTATTSPLIALVDFETDKSSDNGNFDLTFDSRGILRRFPGSVL